MIREMFFAKRSLTALAAAALCLVSAPRPASAQLLNPPPATDLAPTRAALVTRTFNLNPTQVVWFSFTIPEVSPASGLFLDIDTEGTQLSPNDTEIALYDNAGNLVKLNDDGGTGNLSALSFGAATPVRPGYDGGITNGQDGSLVAGTYYLAVFGFNGFNVIGPTGWGVVSSSQANGFVQLHVRLGPPSPIADAGPDQSVPESSFVTLDGSNSVGIEGDTPQLIWTQTAGPAASLNLADPSHPTFTAPSVSGTTTLTFQLEVDSRGVAAFDSVDVVVNDVSPPPGACCDAGGNCTVVVASACAGSALDPATTCSPNPCPPPGPCCSMQLQALHAYNVYSVGSVIQTAGTVISGPRGAGAAHPLPPIPGATTSSLKIIKSGTYPPGSYNALNAPKNSVINLSSGTYYFTNWNIQDGATVNCNTAGGCCVIIITNGLKFNNSNSLLNTGSEALRVHITGGNFTANDRLTVSNTDLLVYHGTAAFHDTTNGTVGVYASGKISFHLGGTISPNQIPDCP